MNMGLIPLTAATGSIRGLLEGLFREIIDAQLGSPQLCAVAGGYEDLTRTHYGTLIWRPCIGSEANMGPIFSQGSYFCSASALMQSNTFTSSCADLLSLVTGMKHIVVDEFFGPYEYDYGSTHRCNHRVRRTGRPLTPEESSVLQARFAVR